MSALPTPVPVRVTYEEYCLLEAKSEKKHDYDAGTIVAMPGGSLNHSRIIANLTREIGSRLKGRPCELLESSFRVGFPGRTYSHYTDGMIVCGKADIDPGDPTGQSLTNPTVVIEVQSPSTADFDRGTKFDHYRTLPSLREYLIVFQDRAEVQSFFKPDDGPWQFASFTGLAGEVPLRSVDIALPLAEIYDRVTFDPPTDEATTTG